MSTVRKNITFTELMNRWVQSVIVQGEYANEGEYVRDLIGHYREKRSKHVALQQAIREGLESGVSEKNVMDVWKEAEKRLKDNHG